MPRYDQVLKYKLPDTRLGGVQRKLGEEYTGAVNKFKELLGKEETAERKELEKKLMLAGHLEGIA